MDTTLPVLIGNAVNQNGCYVPWSRFSGTGRPGYQGVHCYNGGAAKPGIGCSAVRSIIEGATIVGFGDDLVVIFTATHSEDVNVYATETVREAKP